MLQYFQVGGKPPNFHDDDDNDEKDCIMYT